MSERTAALLRDDASHVWHPFTQMQIWPDDAPLVIERAEGNWLIDSEGRRWLDGISSLWVTVHGHRHPHIDAAIREQLNRVAHSTLLGQASVSSIELAKRLVQVAPTGLNRVFFSDSGSTAVEIAVKMAYQFWQLSGRPNKRRFAALSEAYHGDTIGSVSIGGMDLFHERFRHLLFEVDRLPTPALSGKDAALAAAEKLFAERGAELAAVVIEPMVQGAAGMLMQPAGYLSSLQALCRKHDVLLICDEVATGFGRTGKMFAVEHEGVTPDLMCVAKGMTGGYLPLAATLTTERIYQAFLGSFAELKTFFHGHTYTGNALACAAAIANLEVFEREHTLEKVKTTVATLHHSLKTIAELPHVAEVRQCGLMIGIELMRDVKTRAPYAFEERMGFKVCQAMRKHAVLLRPLGNVLVVMPPLSITADEVALLVRALQASITEITE